MSTTITKDMTSDPGGIFSGAGSLRYPWIVDKIITSQIRNEFSRRSWMMDPINQDTDFSFSFKMTPRDNSLMVSAYLKAGMFNSATPDNEHNRIGFEMFKTTVTPMFNIFIRGHSTDGTQFSVGPFRRFSDGNYLMWTDVVDQELQFNFNYDGATKTITVSIYYVASGLEAVIALPLTLTTQVFDIDSFGFGNRYTSSYPNPQPIFTSDISYLTAFTYAPVSAMMIKNTILKNTIAKAV